MKKTHLSLCLIAVVGLLYSSALAEAGPMFEENSSEEEKAEAVKTLEKEMVRTSVDEEDTELTERADLSEEEVSFLAGNKKAQSKAGSTTVALPQVALVTGIATAGAVVADQASNSPVF